MGLTPWSWLRPPAKDIFQIARRWWEAVGEVTADIILGIVSNGASGSLAKLVRGEALVAGASGRIASSLAKVESKTFTRSVAVAKSFADESEEIYKQVAKQNSEAALRISRALDKLEPQVSFEYQKIALIGQDMSGNVLKVRETLEGLGLKVETFSVSEAAYEDWGKMVKLFPDINAIPKNRIRVSLGYMDRW